MNLIWGEVSNLDHQSAELATIFGPSKYITGWHGYYCSTYSDTKSFMYPSILHLFSEFNCPSYLIPSKYKDWSKQNRALLLAVKTSKIFLSLKSLYVSTLLRTGTRRGIIEVGSLMEEALSADIEKALLCLTANRISRVIYLHIPHGPFEIALYIVSRVLHLDAIVLQDSPLYYGFSALKNPLDTFPVYSYDTCISPSSSLSSLEYTTKSHMSLIGDSVMAKLSKLRNSDRLQLEPRPSNSHQNTLSKSRPPWLERNNFKTSYTEHHEYIPPVLETSVNAAACLSEIFHWEGRPTWDLDASIDYRPELSRFTISANNISSFDEIGNFALFTINLQPEATTQVLGCHYASMLDFIRAILCILPAGFKLVIKDHPLNDSEFAFRRSITRWHNLLDFEDIIFADISLNSSLLIDKAQFVCVVTGTSGMEALMKGKYVVYGGCVEYANFSGAICIEDLLRLDKPSDFLIDLLNTVDDSYRDNYRQLLASRYAGYLNYKPMDYAGYEPSVNKKIILASLSNLANLLN